MKCILHNSDAPVRSRRGNPTRAPGYTDSNSPALWLTQFQPGAVPSDGGPHGGRRGPRDFHFGKSGKNRRGRVAIPEIQTGAGRVCKEAGGRRRLKGPPARCTICLMKSLRALGLVIRLKFEEAAALFDPIRR